MSMFKKLKGLFVVEDGTASPEPPKAVESKPQEPQSAPKQSTKKSAPKTPQNSIPSAKPEINVASSGKPDAKFVDVLLKAIEANNEEGFDYLEYKQALQNLNAMDMDTQTKYQSALAMAKTMGVSSSKLIASAKRYVKVLKVEEGKFNQALIAQKTKQVKGREDNVKAHQKAITDKEAQIEKLQKEIEKHKVDLEKVKSEIQASASKVESTNKRFAVAYQSVQNQILKDIQNMEQYLK